MSDHDDRREIDAVRYALGGESDDGTREIARRVAAGDEELARTVAALRRVAGVVRADAQQGPSAETMESLLRMARARSVALPPREEWLVAQPIAVPQGVRGTLPQYEALCLKTDEFQLTVTLLASELATGLVAVGQITSPTGEPLNDIPVALLVDHEEVEETRSDELGEFAFPAAAGVEYMLRLDPGYGPHFVLLRCDENA